MGVGVGGGEKIDCNAKGVSSQREIRRPRRKYNIQKHKTWQHYTTYNVQRTNDSHIHTLSIRKMTRPYGVTTRTRTTYCILRTTYYVLRTTPTIHTVQKEEEKKSIYIYIYTSTLFA